MKSSNLPKKSSNCCCSMCFFKYAKLNASAKDLCLLGSDAVSLGHWFPTFQMIVPLTTSRVITPQRWLFLGSGRWKSHTQSFKMLTGNHWLTTQPSSSRVISSQRITIMGWLPFSIKQHNISTHPAVQCHVPQGLNLQQQYCQKLTLAKHQSCFYREQKVHMQWLNVYTNYEHPINVFHLDIRCWQVH